MFWSFVYSTVHHRHSTSPPYSLQSTTDSVPVLRKLYSLQQTKFQSSVYLSVNYRYSFSYILPATKDPVPVLHILYSRTKTQYKSSVFSTVHYRPRTSPSYTLQPSGDRYRASSPPYTLQSTAVLVLVLRIDSPLQTQYRSSLYSTVLYRPSSSPAYTLQSTTNYVPFLRIQYQSSVNASVHNRISISPPYTLQFPTDPVPLLRILYSPLQTQY